MRTKQETAHAVAILRKKGDQLSLVQLGIIEDRRTEPWVFANYVANVSPQNKNEAAYFAARDAARYVAGSMTMEELIPDVEAYQVNENQDIAIPINMIQMLMDRIEALEKRVAILSNGTGCDAAYLNMADSSKNDFITQEKAYKQIGCSKVTIMSWTKKGLVRGYRSGAHVYYSQSELAENSTVQNYINLKKIGK